MGDYGRVHDRFVVRVFFVVEAGIGAVARAGGFERGAVYGDAG